MNLEAVEKLWSCLAGVRHFAFDARQGPASLTDWSGHAEGTVAVEVIDEANLRFHEQGVFVAAHGARLGIRNTFRWTRSAEGIDLSHERFGDPVFLFRLMPVDTVGSRWVSAEPHTCGSDLYAAQLEFSEGSIALNWTIRGPRKDENLAYLYRPAGSCTPGG